jgi:hypothetical protein
MRRIAAEPWTPHTVAWCERANAVSDYATRVLGAVAADIDGCPPPSISAPASAR